MPTSPLRRLVPCLLVLGAAAVAASCGSTAAEPAPSTVGDIDPAVFDAPGGATPGRRREKVPAVTHLGREVLPRTGLVVRGRVMSLSPAFGGVEIARVAVDEVLRSVPWDRPPDAGDEAVLTVLCGEKGMLPRAGEEAVLLVARRAHSPNHDVIQVIGLDGRDGAARLEALRVYLDVESLPDEQDRVEMLLAYLRRAVVDARKWTRSNAALEYGSLARARPGDLGAADAAVLRGAVLRAAEADVRIALQSALERAERNARSAPREVPVAGTETAGTDRLDAFVRRFLATEDAAARRTVVLDAAVELERDSAPLLRRALADPDPQVREAAIASAGELRLASLGPDLVPLLSEDEPLPVRRSLVRALGYIRERTAVPALQALSRADGEIGDSACYALARIRDEAAIAALERLRNAPDTARRDLVLYLLTDAFVQQEGRLGRPID